MARIDKVRGDTFLEVLELLEISLEAEREDPHTAERIKFIGKQILELIPRSEKDRAHRYKDMFRAAAPRLAEVPRRMRDLDGRDTRIFARDFS